MVDNTLPIPTQKTVVLKFCGIPFFSRTTINIVNFDVEEHYKKLSERMSKDLSSELDKRFKA